MQPDQVIHGRVIGVALKACGTVVPLAHLRIAGPQTDIGIDHLQPRFAGLDQEVLRSRHERLPRLLQQAQDGRLIIHDQHGRTLNLRYPSNVCSARQRQLGVVSLTAGRRICARMRPRIS
jgi:hypothetical protein